MDADTQDNPYLPPQQESAPLIREKAPLPDPRLRGWLAAIFIGVNCSVPFAYAFMPPEWHDRNQAMLMNAASFLLAAVVFLWWFHRCVANAMIMDRSSQLSSAGWAVGSFLIPVVNCVVPCLVMKDLVNSTFKYRPSRTVFPLVLIWWISYVTRALVGTWSHLSVTAALVLLAAVAVAGSTACYLIARISSAQAAFRWSDAPEHDRPVMVALPPTGPGHAPRMLPNAVPAPRPLKIPAKRLTPPPAPKPAAAPPSAPEESET
jgi:hypothetical protein